MNTAREHDCDVLVVGSGAGGLAAALTASVLGLDVVVCEHADVLGGTSAISGGEVWIPLNRQNGGAVNDSAAEALDYLAGVIGPSLDRPRAEAFVHAAATAFAFIEDHSEVEYEALAHVVDYFSTVPGAKDGIRTLGAIPYDGRRLGSHFRKVRSPLAVGMIFGGMAVGREDLPHLLKVFRSPRSFVHVTRMLARHARDRAARHPRGTRMVMGNALVGQLVATLVERRVPMWLETEVVELTMQDGRVNGAVVSDRSGTRRVVCRHGVVLANGSFSGSAAMRRTHFDHVRAGYEHHSHVPSSSDGSGLQLATACGGVIDEHITEPGAWTPVSVVPLRNGSTAAFSHFGDRAKPGVIVVNRAGHRFVNEAINYHDFLMAMFAECAGGVVEAFVITSHTHLRAYGLGRVPARPGRFGPFVRSGYLQRGRTVAELASKIGVDPSALVATVERFNEHARRGEDLDFGRGGTEFERAAGDRSVVPNPCVAPLDRGPWYAIRMIPGDIGTLRGLKVDPAGRVVGGDGDPIDGLYAVGSVATSVMRGTYPAAGIMLGPAVTFGYLAAQDIATRAATAPPLMPGRVAEDHRSTREP